MEEKDLTIHKGEQKEGALCLILKGILDALTGQDLEKTMREEICDQKEVELDCRNLRNVTAEGIRILLAAAKQIKGDVIVSHANDTVREALHGTEFKGILTIAKEGKDKHGTII